MSSTFLSLNLHSTIYSIKLANICDKFKRHIEDILFMICFVYLSISIILNFVVSVCIRSLNLILYAIDSVVNPL